jgi:hypothetical protein
MIVIATNNGHVFLEKLLNDFINHFKDKKICLLDTGSDNIETLFFLNRIKNKEIFSELHLEVIKTPYNGYDSGAYIFAMKNIESDKYYFLHDSISIKNKDFFNDIDKKLEENTVVGFIHFKSNLFDNQEQIDFCINNLGVSDFDLGIFGPMFAINKNDVSKILDNLNFYPTNKNEQMAMERGWSALFKSKNIKLEFLEGEHNNSVFNKDGYKYFDKKFPNRK